MQKILAAQPDNLAALLELSRIAAKRGDAATLKSAVAQIAPDRRPGRRRCNISWRRCSRPLRVRTFAPAATQTTFLRNVLMRVPEYRQSLTAIKAAPGEEAEPFTHFLRLESPVFTPGAGGHRAQLQSATHRQSELSGKLELDRRHSAGQRRRARCRRGEWARSAFVHAGDDSLSPADLPDVPPLPEGIVPLDFNYDFKTDLVLAGAGGVRLLRQDSPSSFTDVTAQAKLPKAVANAPYTGAWAVDIEADGDLDIVLGARAGVPDSFEK